MQPMTEEQVKAREAARKTFGIRLIGEHYEDTERSEPLRSALKRFRDELFAAGYIVQDEQVDLDIVRATGTAKPASTPSKKK